MGILSLLGKITGIEDNLKWSFGKKIEVYGPDFFGLYYIFVSPNGEVAIFLPKSDKTLHIFLGNVLGANRWIKCDSNGKKVKDESISEKAFQWKINRKIILLRGTMLSPNNQVFSIKIISFEEFYEEINDTWLNSKIIEYQKMMSD